MGGKICGTKSRGTLRIKYTDSLKNYVMRNMLTRTDDKPEWKAMIADICSRSDT